MKRWFHGWKYRIDCVLRHYSACVSVLWSSLFGGAVYVKFGEDGRVGRTHLTISDYWSWTILPQHPVYLGHWGRITFLCLRWGCSLAWTLVTGYSRCARVGDYGWVASAALDGIALASTLDTCPLAGCRAAIAFALDSLSGAHLSCTAYAYTEYANPRACVGTAPYFHELHYINGLSCRNNFLFFLHNECVLWDVKIQSSLVLCGGMPVWIRQSYGLLWMWTNVQVVLLLYYI